MEAALKVTFPFPYEPYPLQLEVMRSVYTFIEGCGQSHEVTRSSSLGDDDVTTGRRENVMVVESPTGTGKSQMLLCSVLTAMRPHLDRSFRDHSSASSVVASGLKRERTGGERRSTTTSGRRVKGRSNRSQREVSGNDPNIIVQDGDAAPIDVTSDSSSGDGCNGGSSSSSGEDIAFDGTACGPLVKPKVYFSSRTHTQLTQLIAEYRKTEFGRSPSGSEEQPRTVLPFVHVASRMQLCVNDKIRKRSGGNSEKLNDLCKDAVKASRTKQGRKEVREAFGEKIVTSMTAIDVEDLASNVASSCDVCSFADKSRLRLLREYARSSSRTIEELKEIGTRVGACPFLVSKALVRESPIVFVPYGYLVDETMRNQLLPRDLLIDPSRNDRDGVGLQCSEALKHRMGVFDGDVVVFDEAHNVADVARQACSSGIKLKDIALVLELLSQYAIKYDSRLLVKNKQKLRELSSYLHKCYVFMQQLHRRKVVSPTHSSTMPVAILTLSQFVFDAGVDHINVFSLLRFLEESQLMWKLVSQVGPALNALDVSTDSNNSTGLPVVSRNDLHAAWREICGDLVVFRGAGTISGQSSQSAMLLEVASSYAAKACFSLLSTMRAFALADDAATVAILRPPLADKDAAAPLGVDNTSHFLNCEFSLLCVSGRRAMLPILSSARTVLFAGGTMQPLQMLIHPLLPIRSSGNGHAIDVYGFRYLSMPHVVPSTSLKVFTVGAGPSGLSLELTYANRSQLSTSLIEVGRTVLNLCRVIPFGMIVCFTSYQMEESFIAEAEASGVLAEIQQVKRVFREPRSVSGSRGGGGGQRMLTVDDVLHEYRQWIEGGVSRGNVTSSTMRGALLTCVMGGKLSEGINFNDHLGRGVVVVGLPYPSPNDVELNLTMQYCSAQQGDADPLQVAVERLVGDCDSMTASRGMQYNLELYQSVCMRSVNQTIGRCIRHINDFAVVVLLDRRYHHKAIASKIAKWMLPSVVECKSFADCFRGTREFFASRITPCQ